VEKWERDEIDRRFKRLEEGTRKSEDQIRAIEWRDGMRFHLNVVALYWIAIGTLVVFEIVIAVKG
jgi:hypothetical protein